MRDTRGITLIALVITIIVLLILAGVTISMMLGDNGIINKAKLAKQNMQNAIGEEQEGLQYLQNYIKEESGNGEGNPEGPKTASLMANIHTISTPKREQGYAYGEEIVYEIVITNNGDFPLNKIQVVSNQEGLEIPEIPEEEVLAVGKSKTITCNYTTRLEDMQNPIKPEIAVSADALGGNGEAVTQTVTANTEIEVVTIGKLEEIQVNCEELDSIMYQINVIITNLSEKELAKGTVKVKITPGNTQFEKKIDRLEPGETKTIQETIILDYSYGQDVQGTATVEWEEK